MGSFPLNRKFCVTPFFIFDQIAKQTFEKFPNTLLGDFNIHIDTLSLHNLLQLLSLPYKCSREHFYLQWTVAHYLTGYLDTVCQ